jgi:transposase-like protein
MKRYSEEEKGMWVEDWKGSGKSAWAYAKENGLTPQTFFNWTKERAETAEKFVEVKAMVLKPEEYAPEILIEKGDVKIHIPLRMKWQELRAVIEGLGCQL